MEPVAQNSFERSRWLEVPAPIESVQVTETYKGYSIGIVSYLPNGCYKFNGAEVRRIADGLKLFSTDPVNLSGDELFDLIVDANLPTDIKIEVTNFKRVLGDNKLLSGCSIGVSYVETEIPFSVDELQTGEVHNVTVNDKQAITFTPR